VKVAELSRTVAFRLTLFYSLLFAFCVVMLLGFVYWQTAAEMTRRVDQALLLEKNRLAAVSPGQLPEEVAKSVRRDRRHIYYYGMFSADGHLIAGNIPDFPPELPVDGKVYAITLDANDIQPAPFRARMLAMRLDFGYRLLIGHDVQQLTEFGEIMRRALLWGGLLTILIGLAFGFAFSFRPLRRVKQIQQACEFIMGGDITERLPVSSRRDELDTLAVTVNRMLDEIERLMSEIKHVGDNIAHDLRTPLTRLRAVLYRLQQQMAEDSAQRGMVDQVIVEVDSLLQRFRALLRISEIESNQRRAGFKLLQLQDIVTQAVNFIEPLAEDHAITLSMSGVSGLSVEGDSELLFEAVVNLLDNAIKFTPAGGRVSVRLSQSAKGPEIEIVDNGIGISENERAAVLNRFYRSGSADQVSGFGLGLSIVMAIMQLHDFGFEFGNADPGTRVTLHCWRQHVV
jgi:signal transduction histidine kinase